MSESARRLNAEPEFLAQECAWCRFPFAPEDEVAACTTCNVAHHGACWDRELGCATRGCFNAPLKRLDAVPAKKEGAPAARASRPAPPGKMVCQSCGAFVEIGAPICESCDFITSPDGLYHGPQTTAGEAVTSLVLGIVGLFFCGPILGTLAIIRANEAKKLIQKNPRLKGEWVANAGLGLGITAVVFWVVALMAGVGR